MPFTDGEGLVAHARDAILVAVEGLGHMRILRDSRVADHVVSHLTD